MYLLIFFLIYFLVVFVLRSYLLWRRTGINPLTFNKGDDAHGYNGKVFSIISIIELVVLIIYSFFPKLRDYLLPFWNLEYEALLILGWGLLILSLVLVWISQSNMRDSWRIGIDEKNKSELITSGMFSISRNPIFLSIIIANVGLFLVLPNAFTLLIISLSTISINTQVRLEETYLSDEFGKQYKNYKNTVNRWITLSKKN